MTKSPMASDGVWIGYHDKQKPPVYVVQQAHVDRLIREEGGFVINDPREMQEDQKQSPKDDPQAKIEALLAELARVKAELASVKADARISIEAQPVEKPRRTKSG